MKTLKNKRGGINFVGILIMIVTGLSALFALVTQFNLTGKLQFRKTAKTEFEKVEEFVVQAISNEILNVFEPATAATCGTFSTRFPAALNTVSSVTAGIRFTHLAQGTLPFTTYVGDSVHEAAKVRCRDGQALLSSDNYTAKTGVYFCAQLSPVSGSTDMEIFKDGPVFAEVRVELTNLDTGSSVQCSQFNNPAGNTVRGVMAYYSIYWQKKRNQKAEYFYHRNSARLASRL